MLRHAWFIAVFAAAPLAAQKSGPQGDSWESIAKLPDFSGLWEVTFGGGPRAGGEPPQFTPEYAAKLQAFQAASQRGEIEDGPSANCVPNGMPAIMTQPYPIEILFTPGKVTILIEAYAQLSGGQVGCPIVFRGPGGSALQLGAQHSQAFESWYAHIPGLKVLAPATPADAKGLLKSAIRDDNPVVFIEGEMLYNTKGEVPESEYVTPIGKAEIKREGGDVTLVCHSKTVATALKAAEQLAEQGIAAEVVDLRTIRPLDTETLLNSVGRTHRCVVVEEGWAFAGVGAQVVDEIQRQAFDELDAPILRVTQADVPMPYNKALERAAKADPAKVVDAVKRVMYVG